jgi:hypothetical protein
VLTIDRAYFADRRARSLALPHRAQAWRPSAQWLALRLPPSPVRRLSPFKRFAFELRDIIRRQPLPGYTLFLEVEIGGRTLLAFEPVPACGKAVDGVVPSGTGRRVPSGTDPRAIGNPNRPNPRHEKRKSRP